jgi:hypothetical protein
MGQVCSLLVDGGYVQGMEELRSGTEEYLIGKKPGTALDSHLRDRHG